MDNLSQQSPISQSPQVPAQTNPPLEKPKSSKMIPIIIVAGLLILVGAGSYILGTKKSQPPVQKIITQVSPTPLPTEASAKAGDPTANWKTYTSEISKFTFKYPPSWEFQSSVSQFGSGKSEIAQLFSTKPQKEQNVYFCVDFREYPAGTTPYPLTEKPAKSEKFISLTGKNFSINTYSGNKSIENRLYLTQNGSTIIPTREGRLSEVSGLFNCVGGDNVALGSISDDFDSREEVQTAKEILQTFDFTDQNQTTDTASWKIAGINDPQDFKNFFANFQQLAKMDKKSEIAKLINYPIKSINNESDFIANYDFLFTPKVKTAIINQNVEQTFRNYQGVMVGDGEIWLNAIVGKSGYWITAINN